MFVYVCFRYCVRFCHNVFVCCFCDFVFCCWVLRFVQFCLCLLCVLCCVVFCCVLCVLFEFLHCLFHDFCVRFLVIVMFVSLFFVIACVCLLWFL